MVLATVVATTFPACPSGSGTLAPLIALAMLVAICAAVSPAENLMAVAPLLVPLAPAEVKPVVAEGSAVKSAVALRNVTRWTPKLATPANTPFTALTIDAPNVAAESFTVNVIAVAPAIVVFPLVVNSNVCPLILKDWPLTRLAAGVVELAPPIVGKFNVGPLSNSNVIPAEAATPAKVSLTLFPIRNCWPSTMSLAEFVGSVAAIAIRLTPVVKVPLGITDVPEAAPAVPTLEKG